jgi:hypothetical protein
MFNRINGNGQGTFNAAIAASLLVIALVLASLAAPVRAATLSGTVYGATGVEGLRIGPKSFDLTFHNANSGTYFDTFKTNDVTRAVTAINTEALARSVLGAFQNFLRPIGPIQVNDGQTFLVMPFASSNGRIRYLTTATGSNNYGFVYGAFKADADRDAFFGAVSFVTAQPTGATGGFNSASEGSSAGTFAAALTPVPGPGAGFALLGALSFGAVVLRRRRR